MNVNGACVFIAAMDYKNTFIMKISRFTVRILYSLMDLVTWSQSKGISTIIYRKACFGEVESGGPPGP